MALIKCPECKGQVSDQAGSCPHCGLTLHSAQPQRLTGPGGGRPLTTPPPASVKKSGHGPLYWLGVVVLVGMGTCVALSASSKSSPSSSSASAPPKAPTATSVPREPGNIDAQVMCQQFVEKQLKAPSTAKFPSSREWKIGHSAGTNEYSASSYVDSQNGFGAMIRSQISCDMTYDASTKMWTPRSILVQ